MKKLISMHLRILSLLMVIGFSTAQLFSQEEWNVPADKASKLSTFEFTEESEITGHDIYTSNCASCHGEPTKGNYQALVPPPGDPGSGDFQANTDGELYHKIREGRGLMPSFKNTLTPDETWKLIAYIRSFNSGYIQDVAKEITRGAYDGDVSIFLAHNEQTKMVEATVIGSNSKGTEPIAGAEISLSAQRLFGNLQLDEAKITNKDGKAVFSVSADVPGDSEGNINLLARLTDQDAFGVITADTLFAIGAPMTEGSLLEERALWNKVSKAPVWLLMTYFATVLGVWGALFYILLQLRRIFFIGKESTK
jgi:hypothetical protein